MAQHRSISQRLNRAKSKEAKQKTLTEWANSWEQEQMGLVKDLGKAIAASDYDQECIIAGELKAMSAKKFDALPKVIDLLMDLIDDSTNE